MDLLSITKKILSNHCMLVFLKLCVWILSLVDSVVRCFYHDEFAFICTFVYAYRCFHPVRLSIWTMNVCCLWGRGRRRRRKPRNTDIWIKYWSEKKIQHKNRVENGEKHSAHNRKYIHEITAEPGATEFHRFLSRV